MKFRLELVQVPVTDVDRAKHFYAELLGFGVDHDTTISEDFRFIQLTPPGSECSICVGKGMVAMAPGAQQGLQLVVNDIRAARAQLAQRGVDIGEVQVYGPDGPRPSRDGDALDNVGFAYFSDPDGNGWVLQQISSRT